MTVRMRVSKPSVVAAVRHPIGWASLLVLSLSLVATAQLTDGVLENGDLASVDPAVANAVPALRTPVLTVVARVLDVTGGTAVVATLAMLWAAMLWFRGRDRPAAIWLAGSMGLASVLILAGKHLVGRVRPGIDLVLGPVDTSPAFPSGHTLGTTVFLGLVAAYVGIRARTTLARAIAVAGWVLGSALMAASRVYLGYHWLSDVLAGIAIGTGVLSIAVLVAHLAIHGRRTVVTQVAPSERRHPGHPESGGGHHDGAHREDARTWITLDDQQ